MDKTDKEKMWERLTYVETPLDKVNRLFNEIVVVANDCDLFLTKFSTIKVRNNILMNYVCKNEK
jgi:hypothetical protein